MALLKGKVRKGIPRKGIPRKRLSRRGAAAGRSAGRGASGNALIEFALVLPIFLVLVFGITEFGRAWFTVNLMATASREGARLAVVTGPDVPAVEARVRDVLAAGAIVPTDIDVDGPDPADPDRRVTVTVSANFVVLSAHVLGPFSGTLPLRASTSMRHEAF